jgi:hypothetical protein
MRFCSVAMGMGIGLFIAHSYHLFLPPPKDTIEYIQRAIIGVLGTFACYAMTVLLPTSNAIIYLLPKFLLIGLWLSFGSIFTCRKFFNKLHTSFEAPQ